MDELPNIDQHQSTEESGIPQESITTSHMTNPTSRYIE